MKNNVRSKINGFLKSEEGRVSVKSPLALGVASASLLLAQAMVTPSAQAHWECLPWAPEVHCESGEICVYVCDKWDLETCIGEWHTQCDDHHN